MAGVRTPFSVKLTDGREFRSETLPIDLVIAERQFGGLGEKKQIQGAMFAAMNALKRQEGLEFESFDAFMGQLADYEEWPDEGKARNGAEPGGDTASPGSPTERESRPES